MTYTEPLTLACIAVLLFGVVRIRRCRGAGVLLAGTLLLFALTWPPIDWLLSRPLEAWYPVRPFPAGPADALVVLSASVDPPKRQRPYGVPDQDTFERCEYAAWLYREWRRLPVLATGGSHNPNVAPVAVHMQDLLVRAGVPPGEVFTEERARSTFESAVYAGEMLRARGFKRIALVTDAQSMLRAEACFRKQGFVVVPAPCSFRELGWAFDDVMPSWKSIARNERTLHEALGLLWYKLNGRV